MKQFVLGVFIIINSSVFSQVTINGKLSDEMGNPISGGSVVIKQIGTNNIISYDISKANGKYEIAFSSKLKDLEIWVGNLGFESIKKNIENKSQTQNFELREKLVMIDEIVIKNSPITKKGDTINYSVSSFAKDHDRTIADVLNRLPGIEVLNDGKILYQGKPINKYYIEGLDLLEGKYNLANENLPHKEVVQVQILESHQPIKALENLKFSDNVALNIRLKNAYTFTGQARLGSGFSPLLWDINATPMLFTKKRQILTTYQANNTGENIASQIKKLTIEDVLNQLENNSEKTDWLSVQQLSKPNFSERRWLNNNIHLLSGNYLQKLKKDCELRINASYLNDYQQQNGYTNTLFITPINTITLLEEKHNQLYYNSLQTNFTIHKNSHKNYFKNSLEFQGFWDSQKGNIVLNNENLNQQLNNEFFRFSNTLKSIFPFRKQIFTLNSYLDFNKTPQKLVVNPGQFENLFNNGLSFDEIFQKVDLQKFYTNNSISLTKIVNRFSFEPKIGFQLESQNLYSKISTSESTDVGHDFSNDLHWSRSKIYFNLQTQYKKNKWRLEFSTPVNFHSYQIKDNPLHQSENLNRVTFEPRLSAIYDADSFWKISSSTSISNQFGIINQLHYAYILQNYRNIQRINSTLPQIFNQNYSFGIAYRNPIKTLFWNMMYTNTKSENNLIYQTQVLPNGATELQAIEQDNNRNNHNVSTRTGKYFRKLKSNIILYVALDLQNFRQIINTDLSDISNQNLRVGSKIETDFTDWFNTEYQSDWTFSKNKIQNQSNPTIKQQSHILNLNFYPKENQYLAIKTEYVNNSLFSERTESLFTDLIYRYTLRKKKIDLEIQLTNLFNTTNFRTINLNQFSYVETNYQLRPRQILFKIRISLS